MANVVLTDGGGTVKESYDFVIDGDQIEKLEQHLTKSADTLEACFKDIFDEIDNKLSQSWQGDSYEAFKSKCHEYKNAMDGLVLMYRAIANICSKNIKSAQIDLENEIARAFGYIDPDINQSNNESGTFNNPGSEVVSL